MTGKKKTKRDKRPTVKIRIEFGDILAPVTLKKNEDTGKWRPDYYNVRILKKVTGTKNAANPSAVTSSMPYYRRLLSAMYSGPTIINSNTARKAMAELLDENLTTGPYYKIQEFINHIDSEADRRAESLYVSDNPKPEPKTAATSCTPVYRGPVVPKYGTRAPVPIPQLKAVPPTPPTTKTCVHITHPDSICNFPPLPLFTEAGIDGQQAVVCVADLLKHITGSCHSAHNRLKGTISNHVTAEMVVAGPDRRDEYLTFPAAIYIASVLGAYRVAKNMATKGYELILASQPTDPSPTAS